MRLLPRVVRSRRSITVAVVVFVVSLAVDLGTKEWALHALSMPRPGAPPPVCERDESGYTQIQRLRRPPVVILENHIELRYAENCGAAFGLGNTLGAAARKTLFFGAALLAFFFLTHMFLEGKGGPLFAASVPLILSGAIGNFIDRARHGYVVDFLRFYNLPFIDEYPTFNVADVTISVGVALLLIEGIRPQRAPARPAEEAGEGEASGEEAGGEAGGASATGSPPAGAAAASSPTAEGSVAPRDGGGSTAPGRSG
jgi:signal peptidase II